MKQFLTASVTALALVLMTGLGVRADNVAPNLLGWTYNFSTNAPTGVVYSDGGQSAGVTFTQTGPNDKSAVGNSDVVVTNLTVFSSAAASNPDKLNTNGAYTVGLTLKTTDDTGPHAANLTFTGNKLSGATPTNAFSSGSANVVNAFGANSTQSVILGAYTFTVALGNYTPPGPPSLGSSSGSISAHVTIASNPTTSNGGGAVPEPGTMLLSGLGLSLLGGAAWRKRRQARNAVLASV